MDNYFETFFFDYSSIFRTLGSIIKCIDDNLEEDIIFIHTLWLIRILSIQSIRGTLKYAKLFNVMTVVIYTSMTEFLLLWQKPASSKMNSKPPPPHTLTNWTSYAYAALGCSFDRWHFSYFIVLFRSHLETKSFYCLPMVKGRKGRPPPSPSITNNYGIALSTILCEAQIWETLFMEDQHSPVHNSLPSPRHWCPPKERQKPI